MNSFEQKLEEWEAEAKENDEVCIFCSRALTLIAVIRKQRELIRVVQRDAQLGQATASKENYASTYYFTAEHIIHICNKILQECEELLK